MDLSESSPAGLQSGSSEMQSQAQVGCIHVQGMNRFLMHDNRSSSAGNISATNENSSSRAGASNDGPCCSVRQVFLSRVRNVLRRPAAFSTLESPSERAETEPRQAGGHCSTDHRAFARSVSSQTRRFELDNVNNARHVVPLEFGEQGSDMERTRVPCSSDVQTAIDPATRRGRSLGGERQIVPDSTTRDVSVCRPGNIDIMCHVRPVQRNMQDQNVRFCRASLALSHIKWVVLLIFRRTQVQLQSCRPAIRL